MQSTKSHLQLLKKLVAQNSHTENKSGVDKVGMMVADELDFMKLKKFKHDKWGDLLLFESKNQNTSLPKVLLGGHSDTVHKGDLPIKIENGKFHGPGTQDMKGGLVVIIETLKKLYAKKSLKNISFLLSPEEEYQSVGHRDHFRQIFPNYDIGLVYEPTYQLKDAYEFEPKKRSIVTARKGHGRFKMKISGPGGHSGVIDSKDKRVSTIEEAAHKVIAINELANYKLGTTTNVGIIDAGSSFNVLAEDAYLEGDFRVKTWQEADRITSQLEAIAAKDYSSGTKAEIETIIGMPVMESSPKTDRFAKKIMQLGHKIDLEIIEEKRGGASDANEMSRHVPIVIDGMGVQGYGEHTRNEFIYLDSIPQSIDFSYQVLNMILSGDN